MIGQPDKGIGIAIVGDISTGEATRMVLVPVDMNAPVFDDDEGEVLALEEVTGPDGPTLGPGERIFDLMMPPQIQDGVGDAPVVITDVPFPFIPIDDSKRVM